MFYLLDEEALEDDISGGAMCSFGDNTDHSLYFMDDGIGVWQALPVRHQDLTASYYSAQLLLDLIFEMQDEE